MKGVTVGRRNINNLRYADDTVLLAENEADLQNLLNVIREKKYRIWSKHECKENQSYGDQHTRYSSKSTYPVKWGMLRTRQPVHLLGTADHR